MNEPKVTRQVFKFEMETDHGGKYSAEAHTLHELDLHMAATHRVMPLYPVPARCATCRWAVEWSAFSHWSPSADVKLRCELLSEADEHSLAHATINIDRGFSADVLVSPDFGCVQWEAK